MEISSHFGGQLSGEKKELGSLLIKEFGIFQLISDRGVELKCHSRPCWPDKAIASARELF
jgi:hypothetical protein